MYVRASRPAFARPYVGVHRSTSLMSSFLLLLHCPACLVRLTWIIFVMVGRWPYSWCFVGCCLQEVLKTVYIHTYICAGMWVCGDCSFLSENYHLFIDNCMTLCTQETFRPRPLWQLFEEISTQNDCGSMCLCYIHTTLKVSMVRIKWQTVQYYWLLYINHRFSKIFISPGVIKVPELFSHHAQKYTVFINVFSIWIICFKLLRLFFVNWKYIFLILK